MKFRITRLMSIAVFALLVMLAPSLALAQEGDMQVIDEVVAQVNDDVITLSMLKREMKERVLALVQNGMTEQQATDEVTKTRNELIATLVNEQLLLQKGKELDFGQKVEDEVNRRLKTIAEEQKIPTIEKLYEEMRKQGIVPEEMRQTMRAEIMKQAVLQEDVDAKIFWNLSVPEVQKYFDAHKELFRKPETVTVSVILLGLAGKNEADVKARAEKLVAQLRGGADFGALAAANSEREDQNGERTAPKDKGLIGTFPAPDLREDIGAAIKILKVGGVSDPLKIENAYQILRLDARVPGSDTAVFNENKVREAMTIERSPKARDEYLQNLRNEAYIRISENYYAGVAPLLKLKPEAIVETTGDARPLVPEKKGKGKFLKIFPKP